MLGIADDGVPITTARSARLRRVLMPLLVLTVVGIIVLALSASGRGGGEVVGSGSTLAQPLIDGAAVEYHAARTADDPERPEETSDAGSLTEPAIAYEPVGSLSGIMRLDDREVDFAVADYPLSAEGLAEVEATQFPIAVGAIAVVHNLEGIDSTDGTDSTDSTGTPLRLDADTLAAIYLGEVTRWNDPAIAEANPDLDLPDTAITPVHRSDGSGSTYGLTAYLTAHADAWSDLGTGTRLDWPTGPGAERSSGMVEKVEQTDGALGYVESGQAERAGLAPIAVANAAGEYVPADADSMAAAVADADFAEDPTLGWSAAEAEDPAAYPLTVAIYVLMRSEGDTGETRPALRFLSFLMQRYDAEASGLGYLPLPDAGQDAVLAHWQRTFDFTD